MRRRAVLTMLFLTSSASAQQVRDCRRIVDNLERLTCYDKAVDLGPTAEGLPATEQDEHVVATYEGEGSSITPPFTITAPWEIRWTPADGSVTVFLKTRSGELVDTLTMGEETRPGRAVQPEGGEFVADVHGFRAWRVQAVEVAR